MSCGTIHAHTISFPHYLDRDGFWVWPVSTWPWSFVAPSFMFLGPLQKHICGRPGFIILQIMGVVLPQEVYWICNDVELFDMCQHNAYQNPKFPSKPQRYYKIIVFMLTLICEYQTHRCILIIYFVNSVRQQINSNTTGSRMKCVIFFCKCVLFQSCKIKFSFFVQWKGSPLGCSICQQEAPSNSAVGNTLGTFGSGLYGKYWLTHYPVQEFSNAWLVFVITVTHKKPELVKFRFFSLEKREIAK